MSSSRTLWALAAVSGAMAVLVPNAHAGVTTVEIEGDEVRVWSSATSPTFDDLPNNIRVSEGPSGLTVSEANANVTVTPEPPCSLTAPRTAVCPPDPAVTKLVIYPGPGNDQVAVDLPAVSSTGIVERTINGGPHNDLLIGSPGADRIEGEGKFLPGIGEPGNPGDDVIFGGLGPDLVLGQGGNDYLSGGLPGVTLAEGGNDLQGAAGSDYFDAGATTGPDTFAGQGHDALDDEVVTIDTFGLSGIVGSDVRGGDTVSYGSRTFASAGSAGVKADLDGVADDGTADGSEDDAIGTDVEAIEGTIRNDELTGSAGANRLVGRGGVDTVRGGSGGADFFAIKDGIKDNCVLPGNDDTVDADLQDPTPFECRPRSIVSAAPISFTFLSQPVDETIPHVGVGSLKRNGDEAVTVRVTCARGAEKSCSGEARIAKRTGGATLGRKRFRARPGKTVAVRVKLSEARLAALRKDGAAQVSTVSQGTSDKGPTTTQVQRRIK